jgi:hypothetical protein
MRSSALFLAGGFTGRTYPVNPHAKSIDGLECYPSAAAIPQRVALAIVAVPSRSVPQVIEECGAAHVGAAVVVSAWLGETGPSGVAAESRLRATARPQVFAAVLNLVIRGLLLGVRPRVAEEWSGGFDDPQALSLKPARGPRDGGLPTPVREGPLRSGFRRRRRRRATHAPWPRRSSRRVRTGPNLPQSRPPHRGAW